MRRLNTYNTVQVQSLPASDVAAAKQASVVAFASPSAVKAWLACVGDQDSADVAIACIGAYRLWFLRIPMTAVKGIAEVLCICCCCCMCQLARTSAKAAKHYCTGVPLFKWNMFIKEKGRREVIGSFSCVQEAHQPRRRKSWGSGAYIILTVLVWRVLLNPLWKRLRLPNLLQRLFDPSWAYACHADFLTCVNLTVIQITETILELCARALAMIMMTHTSDVAQL